MSDREASHSVDTRRSGGGGRSVAEGKYTLLAELGQGGMATAYLAAMQGPAGFNKVVVVKKLRPALAKDPELLRMFLKEARLAARIDHPNVVHTSEVGLDGDDYFIAMEYIDGQSLDSILRRGAATSLRETSAELAGSTFTMPLGLHLHVLGNVLAGLHFAHELKDFDGRPFKLVHRDVSPHNVMVTYGGHVKLVDFGIAKAAGTGGSTRAGIYKGKSAYMPAEQFGGKVDRRADLFAVGVMMWQALTGRRLWRGLTDAEVFMRLSRDEVPAPSSVCEVDPGLQAICMKALAFSPVDRYATAADFQAALDDALGNAPTLRTSPRELGRYVSELFVSDRDKVRRVVEDGLGSRAGARAKATSVARLAAASSGPTATVSPHGQTPLLMPVQEGPGRAVEEPTSHDVQPPMPPAIGPRARLRSRSRMVASLCAVPLLGWLLWSTGETRTARGRMLVHAPRAQDAPLRSGRTTLLVLPAEARLSIDGARVAGNPVELERDERRHLVLAEAYGYAARSEWISFDGAAHSITLAPLEEGAAASERAKGLLPNRRSPYEPGFAPRAEASSVVPALPSAKVHGLDQTDPWAK